MYVAIYIILCVCMSVVTYCICNSFEGGQLRGYIYSRSEHIMYDNIYVHNVIFHTSKFLFITTISHFKTFSIFHKTTKPQTFLS